MGAREAREGLPWELLCADDRVLFAESEDEPKEIKKGCVR